MFQGFIGNLLFKNYHLVGIAIDNKTNDDDRSVSRYTLFLTINDRLRQIRQALDIGKVKKFPKKERKKFYTHLRSYMGSSTSHS